MLQCEESKTYNKKFGDTTYTAISEALPGTNEDMLDSLLRLLQREAEDSSGAENTP